MALGLPLTDFNIRWYHVYSTIAFLVANLWNFQLNRWWTFRSAQHSGWLREYLPSSPSVSSAYCRPRHPDPADAPRIDVLAVDRRSSTTPPASGPGFYWAQLITIAIVTPLSFVLNKIWTFSARARQGIVTGAPELGGRRAVIRRVTRGEWRRSQRSGGNARGPGRDRRSTRTELTRARRRSRVRAPSPATCTRRERHGRVYLKSLTLRGFKSFASATTLNFEPGITCVVGPNGSGKSNVVDALSLGDGRAGRQVTARRQDGGRHLRRHLRPGAAGPRRGAADHRQLRRRAADRLLRGHHLPDHVPQRRLRVRDQRRHCRLLDVQELLSDSGIGREMHVIVGQGQLDSILQATPEGRRGFIEEAAGVLKHRKRKEKALRKLEACEGNLTRLSDLITEIRRQLKPLGRQAEVARKAAVDPGRRPRRQGPAARRRPGAGAAGAGVRRWPTSRR